MSPVIISQLGMTITVANPLLGSEAPVPPYEQNDFVALDSQLAKPYPSCSYAHRPIDAMLELRSQINDLSAIEHMSLKVPRAFLDVDGKRAPQTPPEARFSMTWCIAAAAVDGEVRIPHFEPEALKRPELHALERMIEVITYEPAGGATDLDEAAPDTLQINLKNGSTLSSTVGKVRGSSAWPMTTAEHQAKFTDCMDRHFCTTRTAEIFGELQAFDADRRVAELLGCLSLDHQ